MHSIGRMAWSPDGRSLATPSNKDLLLWATQTGKYRRFSGHTGRVFAAAFHPEGSKLATGSEDRTARLWDVKSGLTLCALAGHQGPVWDVAFHPDGNTLATASYDRTIKLWDVSGQLLNSLQQASLPHCIAFDTAGQVLASGGEDGKIILWDPLTGRQLAALKGHSSAVLTIAFDPISSRLASGGWDRAIKLWDINNQRLLTTLERHTNYIQWLGFSFDGRVLASGNAHNRKVLLWDGKTGQHLCDVNLEYSQRDSTKRSHAFHPRLPVLAIADPERVAGVGTANAVIQICELDLSILFGLRTAPEITYASAKVVLVGESNVGKSYLAHRIATGLAPEPGSIQSTHGMRFWPMQPERLSSMAQTPDGQRRDVVLWDMGGQREYRLIHQLFLHDTTVALVLFDPSRGASAFRDAETWNKYLDKQLGGREAVKLLVGAKMDQPSDTIDRQGLARVVEDCGFHKFYETSAITGRGIADFCKAVAQAIDWNSLGKTNRPELFQQIRDEIDARQKRGEVFLPLRELETELLTDNEEQENGVGAVDAVTRQLATQGVIARSQTAKGEPVLVLQVHEIERYAGSLIVAARDNPRGVPALELRTLARSEFSFPGIETKDRLPINQEQTVIECTVQLMLEHGICFQHEGLLIFPTLFVPIGEDTESPLPHAVSLYYDFAGAIDNIYASLVAWLVLARNFGRVRLWADRAEFEMKDGGLCGLRKVRRSSGFAHVDVYFESQTPTLRRKEFIDFVEDHLSKNGVEIRERIVVPCPKQFIFDEETLRIRIAEGAGDVLCPRCEERHSLTEGAVEARTRDQGIVEKTWALKTEIEKLREKVTRQTIQLLEKAQLSTVDRPIRLLHLSDLHFTPHTPTSARLQWLLDDLKQSSGLGFKELDYLVISGDFTDKGNTEGFEKAYDFVSSLSREFALSAERCIFVPGNHDVVDRLDAYSRRKNSSGLNADEWFEVGQLVMARDAEKYALRFKPFSDGFYHKFLQRPYPIDYAEQGTAIPFWETRLQFITLNSCWQIDEFNRKRASLHPEAVAHAIKQAQKQEHEARQIGNLSAHENVLRIAAWHHSVAGAEQMKNVDFLGNLQKNGVRIVLHGDVHEMQRELIGYRHEKRVHIVGSGSFGARAEDRPESTPRLYNVLEIARDLKSARVHTREQRKPDGAWDGWHEWPDPEGGKGRLPYYDINLE